MKIRTLIAAACLVPTLALGGCGLGTAGGFVPTAELDGELSAIDLSGTHVSIGSKNFTEQIILGKIGAILLQSAGADVEDLTNVPGSTSARQALVAGDMDMMFEYTGTAWITYLGKTDPIPDTQKQYEAVKDADAANGLTWLPPAPMNNTYALAVSEDTAQEYGMESLDDITKLPVEEQTICSDAEFIARNDGLMPMLDAYGVEQPSRERLLEMDSGAVYAALDRGECRLGSVFATDGRIDALDLHVLSDPKGFFPKYNMAPVVRTEVIEENPEIAELLAPLSDILTDERMQQLNARVDVDGEDYATVAYDFLREEGLIS
ncbi:glycine betaine ABC transporter substrate-binding protein [Corynebacterium sp. 32222D000AT]|uniref:glycine betaine ABC transporter substrate-binding protein n=1 Tax=unclassified Corynebacterium TaxID=2624378 RepID=UPI002A9AA9EE|nr:glycine betaine ABC transporter substrate-binding protein [Mycobacteriaceae bacterium]MDY5830045.1 glycine betaine ABC transporter substrate-binding protein [Corynebacterium sp.]